MKKTLNFLSMIIALTVLPSAAFAQLGEWDSDKARDNCIAATEETRTPAEDVSTRRQTEESEATSAEQGN